MKLDGNLAKAKTLGLSVVPADSRTLQIDLDSHRAVCAYGNHYKLLTEHGLTKGWKPSITPSERKGHAHVTIKLPKPMPLLKRILYQAILRSDITRELFNTIRAEKKRKYPVIFFERVK